MDKIKINKANGHIIPMLVDVPETADTVLIVIHGFTSYKESPTAQLMLRRMPAAGIGVIAYDQPGHGTEEAKEDEFRVENCMDSLAAVEQYILDNYPGKEIVYLGSSYGAYMGALYAGRRPHKGTKFMMRSGAVVMPNLLLDISDSEKDQQAKADLEEQGYLDVGVPGGDHMMVPKGFFEDLALPENDLNSNFGDSDNGGTKFFMVHGTADRVAPVETATAFAARYDVPIVLFEGEGHSISDDPASPEKVADLAIDFYRKK